MSTSSTVIDLTPFLTPIWELIGTAIAGIVVGILVSLWNLIANKFHLSNLQITQDTQARIDVEAQKFIGGAIHDIGLPAHLDVDAKNAVIAQAANKLVLEVGTEIKKLNPQAATSGQALAQAAIDIIKNRLGMMAATQAGTPIPNPSADAKGPAVATVPASVVIPPPVVVSTEPIETK